MILPQSIHDGLLELGKKYEKDGKVLIVSFYSRDPKAPPKQNEDGTPDICPLAGDYEHIRINTRYGAIDIALFEEFGKQQIHDMRNIICSP
jgi:hypothetical protein